MIVSEVGAGACDAARGGVIAELSEIARAEVGQRVMLPVTPDVLYRIELGGIARQPFEHQPALLGTDEVAYQPRPMRWQAVPDHQQPAPQLTQQMAEEVNHLGRADGGRVQPEVKVRPSDAGSGRQLLPIEVILHHRGLPARRPGSYPMRPFAQSAFVDEDDRAPLAEGFLLIGGPRDFFQWRM